MGRPTERGTAVLILLNGPPGSGKSTLAQRYVDAHPLALNLDVDRVRALIGGWREDRGSAGRLARSLALAAARVHLSAGYDVVVPQFLGRLPFLEQLEQLAVEVGVAFHEIVLWDGRAEAVRRFAARDSSPDPGHRDARDSVAAAGGTPALEAMYDLLAALLAARPTARVIPTRDGDVDGAYRDFLAALSRPAGGASRRRLE